MKRVVTGQPLGSARVVPDAFCFGIGRTKRNGLEPEQMLYLKSLNLKGFKSFAESTTLDLEPGVTVVVGPNGSGKSKRRRRPSPGCSARKPRVPCGRKKMDDVIFAGTSKPPSARFAPRVRSHDRQLRSGILPIEFNEVTITRHALFAPATASYAINGAPCRLPRHPRSPVRQRCRSSAARDHQSGSDRCRAQRESRKKRRLIIEEGRRRPEVPQAQGEVGNVRLQATEGNLLRLAGSPP